MIESKLKGVEFVACNTDAQALQHSKCKKKIQLGVKSTRGLGAGMRPDVGRQAAEETLEEIGIRGKDIFESAGGESLTLLPCLNDHPSWIRFLVNKIESWLDSD